MNYLDKIRRAKNRFEAADLIRANACKNASALHCYNDSERISIVDEAERQAQDLERDFAFNGGDPCPENLHPWKQWLKHWTYLDQI